MNTETARIRLGHPACPGVMREMAGALQSLPHDKPLRLTLPPVTPALEQELDILLEILRMRRDVEISANDWGTLARLSAWKKTCAHPPRLILGILLSGQDSDPVIRTFLEPQPDNAVRAGQETVTLRWAPPPDSLIRHWAEPSAFHWAPLLKEMGVDGIELGLQPLPLPERVAPQPVECFPWGVISVKPCRGNCAACGGPDTVRAGCRLFFDRNLLLWEPLAMNGGQAK